MTDDQNSRRSSPRVKCRWQVKCVTEQKKMFMTNSINISQGGVLIVTPVPFKTGDRLYVEIAGIISGRTHLIKAVGKVAYFSVSSDNLMQIGLEFISHLGIDDLKFIQTYVKVMLNG